MIAARRLARVTSLFALLLLAACETPHGSAVGRASESSGGGRISVGWPF